MKILHVIAGLDPRQGGPSAACLGAAALMARRGHDVRIVTAHRSAEEESYGRGSGLEVDSSPVDWPAWFGTSWPMRRRLRAAIAAVDVVHLHSLYLFHDWVAGDYCRRLGTPYIVRPHGTLDPYIRRRHKLRKRIAGKLFQDRVLRDACGLHYTAAEEWELARPSARNERGWIAPNGVTLEEFERLPPREALRRRYPAIGERKVVLFLGRLHLKKGLDVAIRAFAEIARERDDVFLVLAGPDDGMRADAERWIAECGIGPISLFTGMVSGEAKREVLGGSDVFLLPSMSENFGIAVIEAAASGIPVVVSDRVNLWRDFDAAGAGLVAPPTVEGFAAQLGRLLAHSELAARIARNGAELVRGKYSWDALGPLYEEMYATAIRCRALPRVEP